jgi:hypothetical protein
MEARLARPLPVLPVAPATPGPDAPVASHAAPAGRRRAGIARAAFPGSGARPARTEAR